MFKPLKNAPNRNWLVGLCWLILVGTACEAAECGEDPYGDPLNDPCNSYHYVPNKFGNIFFAALFLATGLALTACYVHRPVKHMLVLIAGVYLYALGMFCRVMDRNHLDELGWQLAAQLLVVLSPCLLLAADYLLLDRLVAHLSSETLIRPLKPRSVARIFLISDLITLNMQSTGSSMTSTKSAIVAKIGRDLLLAGLIAQLISFIFFTGLCMIWYSRVRRQARELLDLPMWQFLFWALLSTCANLLVRCFYRTIEFAQGTKGSITLNEVLFFTLDCVPCWSMAATFIPFWPGWFLTSKNKVRPSAPLVLDSETGADAPPPAAEREEAEAYQMAKRPKTGPTAFGRFLRSGRQAS